MRVQMQYGAYASSSCLDYTYGETEDYTVNITGNAHLEEPGSEISSTGGTLEILLYPNPAQDNLSVEFTGNQKGNAVVNIYDLVGKKVCSNEFFTDEGLNKLRINTAQLNKGIYTLEIICNGELQRQKFMIGR